MKYDIGLRQCSTCGSDEFIVSEDTTGRNGSFVSCAQCGRSSKKHTNLKDACDAWNVMATCFAMHHAAMKLLFHIRGFEREQGIRFNGSVELDARMRDFEDETSAPGDADAQIAEDIKSNESERMVGIGCLCVASRTPALAAPANKQETP